MEVLRVQRPRRQQAFAHAARHTLSAPGDTVRIDATENKLVITKGEVEVVEERKLERSRPSAR